MPIVLLIILLNLMYACEVGADHWPVYAHSLTKHQECYQCPPGYYFEAECDVDRRHNPGHSKCKRCADNQFTASWGQTKNCWEHTACPKGEKVLYNGQSTGPVLCDCELGKTRTAENGQCMEAVLKTKYETLLEDYNTLLKKFTEVSSELDACRNKPTRRSNICPECSPCFPTTIVYGPELSEPTRNAIHTVATPYTPTTKNPTSVNSKIISIDRRIFVMLCIGSFTGGCIFLLMIMIYFKKTRKGKGSREKASDSNGIVPSGSKKNHENSKSDGTFSSQNNGSLAPSPVDKPKEEKSFGIIKTNERKENEKDFIVNIEPEDKDNSEKDSEGQNSASSSGTQPFLDEKSPSSELNPATKLDKEDSTTEHIEYIDEGPGDDLKANIETVDDVEQDRKRHLDAACRIIEKRVASDPVQFNRQVLELCMEVCERIDNEENGVYKKVMAGLSKWKSLMGDNATVEYLIDQLRKYNRKDIADEIAKELSESGFVYGAPSSVSSDDRLDRAFAIYERKRSRNTGSKPFFREYLKLDLLCLESLPQDSFVSQALAEWRRRQGRQATVELFCDLLREARDYDIVDEIEDILPNPNVETRPLISQQTVNCQLPDQRQTEDDGANQQVTVPKYPTQSSGDNLQPETGTQESSSQSPEDESDRPFSGNEDEEQPEKCKDDSKTYEDVDYVDENDPQSSKSSGLDAIKKKKKKRHKKESALPKR